MGKKSETNDKLLIYEHISCEEDFKCTFLSLNNLGTKFNKHIDTLKTSTLICCERKQYMQNLSI